MKFLNLEIENFGSIGVLNIALADRGLVLITGRNEDATKADSNGAGKSLILEAFCWCLWGQTIRGLRGDDVVNELVGKDCKVTLLLEEGGSTYQVHRTRKYSTGKPNDLRVYQHNVEETKVTSLLHDISGASMSATQEIIDELIGMTFTLFCVMMPGAGKRAAEMTDLQVKALLERLLQTVVLGRAHDEVKAQLKKVEFDMAHGRTRREMLDRAIDECNTRLGDLKDKFDGYSDKKEEEILSIQAQIGEILIQLEGHNTVIERAEKATDKGEDAKEKLQTIVSEIDFLHQNFSLIRTTYDSGREGRDVACGVIHQKRVNLEQQLSLLPAAGGDCPTCHQEVPEEHVVGVRALLHKSLQEVLGESEKLDRRSKGSAAGYQTAQEDLRATLKATEIRRGVIDADLTRFKGWQTERATAVAVRANLMGQMKDLSTRQDVLVAEENPLQGLIAVTCEDAYNKAAEASRVYKDIKLLEHQEAVLDYWLTGFSPQGVRSFMLEHVTPLLNHSAAKYADLLTDGEMSVTFHTQQRQKSGKTVEKFNISVEHVHGGGSYAASSAGEKSRANLVVAFALGDLAALRANKTVSFRFLDEPFESVDESGTDAIVSLLNDQKERFETVFVITHQDHFKQLFPNRITVVKKDGMTSLENCYE